MRNKNIFILFISVALLSACGSENGQSEATSLDTAITSNASSDLANTQEILYALPSPVEAAALMKMSGATFDKAFLNPTNNVSKYVSNQSKSLNLGVYGTDLIYSSIFEQTQETGEYFKCANTLASSLGINDAFGEAVYKRLKSNMNNRDSLMSIVAEASLNADAYFKENERPTASALVAAGGWIEGLYIATRVANKTKSPEIFQRVADQKNSIKHLIKLIESFGPEQELVSVLMDLKEISAQFDVLVVTKEAATKSESTDGVPTIGVKKKVTITEEQMKAIADKAEMVRNKIIM